MYRTKPLRIPFRNSFGEMSTEVAVRKIKFQSRMCLWLVKWPISLNHLSLRWIFSYTMGITILCKSTLGPLDSWQAHEIMDVEVLTTVVTSMSWVFIACKTSLRWFLNCTVKMIKTFHLFWFEFQRQLSKSNILREVFSDTPQNRHLLPLSQSIPSLSF